MTIKIEIEAHPDRGDMGKQVEQAMSALGFHRVSSAGSRPSLQEWPDAETAARQVAEMVAAAEESEAEAKIVTGVAEASQPAEEAPVLDTRAVGSASEGRARRTKVEIAEDGEFEKLAVEKGVSLTKLNEVFGKVGRAEAKAQLSSLDVADKQTDEPQAISTGENRVGPEDEQDAADEAAETEKSGLAPIDVLRRLLGDYQKAHGMPAAVKLCQEGGLIGAPIHELDDAGIEKAIAALKASPLSPETKPEAKPAETVAPKTKADLIEAMMRYGDKFDGTREQKDMKFTLIDCPAIFTDVFGPEVTKLSLVPEDGYGKAVAAIEQAIATDPFGRAK